MENTMILCLVVKHGAFLYTWSKTLDFFFNGLDMYPDITPLLAFLYKYKIIFLEHPTVKPCLTR